MTRAFLRRLLLTAALGSAGCTAVQDVVADVSTTDIERLATQTRGAQGWFVAARIDGVQALPEVQWFSVEEKLDHVIYDYFPADFACVSLDTWATCDPDEALRVLVPQLKLIDRDGMSDEDWARLSTLCTRCNFGDEALAAVAPLRVERETSGITVEYARRVIVGFDPATFVHRDEISADGTVVRTKDEFTKPERETGRDASSGDVASVLRRQQPAFDKCAANHGAIDGTLLKVEFEVTGGGLVERATPFAPYQRTPLGLCVAGVVAESTFPPTAVARRAEQATIKLRRPDPAK